jgi:hypothetical protein
MRACPRILVGIAVSSSLIGGAYMGYMSAPGELSGEQKKVLHPIIAEWDALPFEERKRLLRVAGAYSSLPPEMQHRVSERLFGWVALSAEERNSARERYRQFRSLPPDKRRDLINKWKKQFR